MGGQLDGILLDDAPQTLPLVSICVPAYQQVAYLKKLLDSVLLQDFKNFEVIITDDSPDDSVQRLVGKYLIDSRFRYFKNTPALGTPQNWNEAVCRANGKYIKIMHHDDWFTERHSLRTLVDILEQHPESDFVFCATDIRNADTDAHVRLNQPTAQQIEMMVNLPESLILGNVLGVPSATLYCRNNDIPVYDLRIKFLVDVDFYVAAIRQNAHIQYDPRALVGVGVSATQVTTHALKDKNLMLFEYFYFAQKHRLNLAREPYFSFFTELLKKYRVRNVSDIKAAGFNGALDERTLKKMIGRRHFYGWEARFRRWVMAIKSKIR